MRIQDLQRLVLGVARFWGGRLVVLAGVMGVGAGVCGAETVLMPGFKKEVQPILQQNCYECHGNGAKNGGIAFDALTTEESLKNPEMWLNVMKNTRAGLMPPPEEHKRLGSEKQKVLDNWIEYSAFGVDREHLDPGRVTVRRLNKTEYRNTIRDLMGFDYDTTVAFPADDVGYGFDTIGEVQSLSPMRMEKFFEAAQFIVDKSVPTLTRALTLQFATGKEFLTSDGSKNGDPMNFYEHRVVSKKFNARVAGDYRIEAYIMVDGTNKKDLQRCTVTLNDNGKEIFQKEYEWYDCEFYTHVLPEKWEAGEHELSFEIVPKDPTMKQTQKLDYKVLTVSVYGPLNEKDWVNPPGYERFFTRDVPPEGAEARRAYAREVLTKFATKAFRRPVSAETIDPLVAIAEKTYTTGGNSFEAGVSRAMVAVLASPRFLFRVETGEAVKGSAYGNVDEYALASRLSYLLWSSMPDEELMKLAGAGKLRANLAGQVKRMFADGRSKAFIENFTGQWLNTREIMQASLNPVEIMKRENVSGKDVPVITMEGRLAMKQEPEAYFEYVARENRDVVEFLTSNYTFLNETLAKYYGVSGVTGAQMRKVEMPAEKHRGGLLTMASVLATTSDPNRTSPVKRGKWVLENILGTPPPPPPANIPPLEDAVKKFQDHVPTQREALAAHRMDALCASCHNRMDPLGLSMENFNAMGLWREREQGQAVDATGELMTGEKFKDVGELKGLLVANYRVDFYRTLTEKLMTYALGRGLEYYDMPTVDKIVERMEHEDGHFSALLMGVVESAPFQQRRMDASPAEKGKP